MQQFRIDKNPLSKVYLTSEGYIKGTAIVTRTGIFKYVDNQGNIRLELRHPDDVLEEDSLESLKQIPITVEHPIVLVDSSNVKQLGVGLTGETVKIDGENIKTTVTITAIEGVEAINNGKEELSLGYTLDLEEEEGIYNGQPYTHRQKNIRYNHLAIVERGRAGANARLNFDSFECGMIVDENITHERENMVKINIDNVDVEVDEAVKKAYDSLNARLDAEIKSKSDIQKEVDSLKARLDEKEEELKKAKEINSDSAISEKAKARVELIAKAGKVVNIDGLYDLSDRDIKLSVIKSRYDSLDLTDKSDDYVSARFDAICEALTNNDEAIKKQQSQAKEVNETKKNLDALELVKNQWKEIK